MLKIKHLSKCFGEKFVLKDFSAAFDVGIHGISAPSGSGKTTLLRIIAGLEDADSGEITGGGKISMDFQEPRLLPWLSTEKNAAISERKNGLASEILCELGLSDERDKLPKKLSGGMQNRVALARALSCEFDTLLLDEPFTGLDAECSEKALLTVKRYAKEKCVLLVTHDKKTLSMLDSVTVL